MIKTSDEMRKLIFLLIALVAMTTQAQADGKVVFTASAPDAVVVGDQFRLSYTVNTIKVRDFRVPSIKGFEVLMDLTVHNVCNRLMGLLIIVLPLLIS